MLPPGMAWDCAVPYLAALGVCVKQESSGDNNPIEYRIVWHSGEDAVPHWHYVPLQCCAWGYLRPADIEGPASLRCVDVLFALKLEQWADLGDVAVQG